MYQNLLKNLVGVLSTAKFLSSNQFLVLRFVHFETYSISTPQFKSGYFYPIKHFHTSAIQWKAKGKKSGSKLQELIRPNDAADIIDLIEVQSDMENIVKKLKTDFAIDFRVGSDIPLEQMEVTVEGDAYNLNEIALISKPSPRLIEVDMVNFPEFVTVVEKAIRSSKWNLNPSIKGTIIKVPIPQVSAERRTAVAKAAKIRLSTSKTELKQFCEKLAKFFKQHENMTEDLEYILNKQIQVYHDHYLNEAELLYKGKEKEILHPH